jgi:glyoxylase-like metal-dependent hydrolase (beta-lactamase superfamily II)
MEKTVQVYLIEGDPLTLIDTGMRTPESRAALESALEGLGYGLPEIERVVLTHAHPEQAGLVQSIRDAGASLECWVHEDDAHTVEAQHEVLLGRVANERLLFREFGVPEAMLERLHAHRLDTLDRRQSERESTTVERVLRHEERVAFKDFGLVVQHSPGHTPGHILLEDEELGLLFTGDQLMAQAIPSTENHYLEGRLPDPADPLRRRPRFRGLLEMRRSLRRLRGRPLKSVLPGYGGQILRADRAVRDTLLLYDVRIQRIDR